MEYLHREGFADTLRYAFNKPRTDVGDFPRTGDAANLGSTQGIILVAKGNVYFVLKDIEQEILLGTVQDAQEAIRTHKWQPKAYGWEINRLRHKTPPPPPPRKVLR